MTDEILKIKLSEIHVTENPRKKLENLDELGASLKQDGQLSAIIVTPRRAGGYELVAGGRRYAAAQRIGWKTIEAKVKKLSGPAVRKIRMIENIQRDDLPSADTSEGVFELLQDFKQSEIPDILSKSKSWVSRRLAHAKVIEAVPLARELEYNTAAIIASVDKVHWKELVDGAVTATRPRAWVERQIAKISSGVAREQRKGKLPAKIERSIEELDHYLSAEHPATVKAELEKRLKAVLQKLS